MVEHLIDMQLSTSAYQVCCIAIDLQMHWSKIQLGYGQNSETHRVEQEALSSEQIWKTYARQKDTVS